MVYLWAVLHDRPTSWACEARNWPTDLWPGKLPSQATMSRRLPTTEVQLLLARMERRDAPLARSGFVLLIDGKPLKVGSHSKDTDARWGRDRRGWAKGDKVHALYGTERLPRTWEVMPLNVAEPEVAARLILSQREGGGYILGDKIFDSNPLHDAALAVGCQLVAQRKRRHGGLGSTPPRLAH